MSIGEILKSETAALHTQAEQHPFQKAMIKGELPLAAYGAYLAQMLHVHRALERSLESLSALSPIRDVASSEQFREQHILADLRELGVEEAEPMEGTRAIVEQIGELAERQNAAALLGMHYVLEGSTNGGRFIARAMAHAYQLKSGPGLSYLDPYGEQQQERWAAFREAMNSTVSETEMGDAMLNGATTMFQGVIGVLESLGGVWSVKPRVYSSANWSRTTSTAASGVTSS